MPPGFMNGSGAYLPAARGERDRGTLHWRRGHPAQLDVGLASTILFMSLIFRTADQILCSLVPIGTHFIWHLLNGLVLALYLEAAIRYGGGVRAEDRSPKKNWPRRRMPSGAQS